MLTLDLTEHIFIDATLKLTLFHKKVEQTKIEKL